MKYYIGDHEFKTKGDAKQAVKNILNKDRMNPRLDITEETFILCVFYNRESNRDRVELTNIAYIYIQDNGKGSNEFVIKTKDGQYIIFSYLKCFNEKTPRVKFSDACRLAIVPYKPYCPDGMERHHTGDTMSDIIDMFVSENNIDIHSIEYLDAEFKDPNMRSKFNAFHEKHAEYLIVTKEEHKKLHSV
jgi:hypothetical protein